MRTWTGAAQIQAAMRLLLLLVCLASAANAQQGAPPDLLRSVGATLLCRHDTVTAADVERGVAFSLWFAEGLAQPPDRELYAAYSADGRPLRLIVLANVPTRRRQFNTYALAVYFGPDDQALGMRMDGAGTDSTADLTDSSKPPIRMTESETARARSLAERLWTIRCSARPGR